MGYPGGKGGAGVYQSIINEMPPHRTYIEPFAGGASIARRKRPADRTILVDLAPAALAMHAGAGFTLHRGCGIAFLAGHRFRPGTLVYADPPYPRAARRSARAIYEHEMSDQLHTRLLAVLQGLPCAVIVSGYRCEIYFTTPPWPAGGARPSRP